jgi:hypothetical protein
MKITYEPPPIYFMHVPKTGGTAVGTWLQTIYRARDYVELEIVRVAALAHDRLTNFRCYNSPHHGHGMLEWVTRTDLTAFTILREPIERSVSSYEYQRRRQCLRWTNAPSPTTEREMQKFNTSIDDVAQQRLMNIVGTQTDFLGRRRDYGTFFEYVRLRRAGGDVFPLVKPYGIMDVADTNSPQQIYDRAVAWLHEMPVVGLTERFAESMLLIADMLGVSAPAAPPQANVNPERRDARQRYRDSLTPATLERLNEINKQDFELYAVAEDLFEQQWARFQKRRRRTISIAPRLRSSKRRITRIFSRSQAGPAGQRP